MVFVTIFRLAFISLLSFIMSVSVAFAVDSEITRQTLKGIKGVYLVIEDMQPNIQRHAAKAGLTKDQLHKDIEYRLREKGVKLLTSDNWSKTQGAPVLYINVNTHEKEKYWFAYHIKIALQQAVMMEINPKLRILATTWSINTTGTANIGNLNVIKSDVMALVDRFTEAYKAVNTK